MIEKKMKIVLVSLCRQKRPLKELKNKKIFGEKKIKNDVNKKFKEKK